MEKILLAVFTVIVSATLIFLVAVFSGFTIATLWAWFVVPLGVKAISYANAYGLAILSSVFMGIRISGAASSKDIVVKGVILNIFALLFGFITVQFM